MTNLKEIPTADLLNELWERKNELNETILEDLIADKFGKDFSNPDLPSFEATEKAFDSLPTNFLTK